MKLIYLSIAALTFGLSSCSTTQNAGRKNVADDDVYYSSTPSATRPLDGPRYEEPQYRNGDAVPRYQENATLAPRTDTGRYYSDMNGSAKTGTTNIQNYYGVVPSDPFFNPAGYPYSPYSPYGSYGSYSPYSAYGYGYGYPRAYGPYSSFSFGFGSGFGSYLGIGFGFDPFYGYSYGYPVYPVYARPFYGLRPSWREGGRYGGHYRDEGNGSYYGGNTYAPRRSRDGAGSGGGNSGEGSGSTGGYPSGGNPNGGPYRGGSVGYTPRPSRSVEATRGAYVPPATSLENGSQPINSSANGSVPSGVYNSPNRVNVFRGNRNYNSDVVGGPRGGQVSPGQQSRPTGVYNVPGRSFDRTSAPGSYVPRPRESSFGGYREGGYNNSPRFNSAPRSYSPPASSPSIGGGYSAPSGGNFGGRRGR